MGEWNGNYNCVFFTVFRVFERIQMEQIHFGRHNSELGLPVSTISNV